MKRKANPKHNPTPLPKATDCPCCRGLGIISEIEEFKGPFHAATHRIQVTTRDSFGDLISGRNVGSLDCPTVSDLQAAMLIIHGQALTPPDEWRGKMVEISSTKNGEIVFSIRVPK